MKENFEKFSKLLELINCDFLEHFIKMKNLPVFMSKRTTEFSKMFVQIFYDFWKAEIQIAYFFKSSSGAPLVEIQKILYQGFWHFRPRKLFFFF